MSVCRRTNSVQYCIISKMLSNQIHRNYAHIHLNVTQAELDTSTNQWFWNRDFGTPVDF